MKLLIAALLTFITLCNIAKADRILIYRGSLTRRTFDADSHTVSITSYYYLFDIDTLQSASINYFKSKGDKLYQSSLSPFIYAPVATSLKTSKSLFVFSTTFTSNGFNINSSVFSGSDRQQSFGGTFTGSFPIVLSFTSFGVSGNATIPQDTQFMASGAFRLQTLLTTESNASNDNLTTAASIVTNLLAQEGYIAQ